MTVHPTNKKTLMLVNAERGDRGLNPLNLDATLLSVISYSHSQEEVHYRYYDHRSPINQPNLASPNPPGDRAKVNPAIQGHNWLCCAENISLSENPGAMIYQFMYQDSQTLSGKPEDAWGHRQTILGYHSQVDQAPGHYTWIGIGLKRSIDRPNDFYYTLDFLDDSRSTKYMSPETADNSFPTMARPTIVDANTVQVTNVWDNNDGKTPGAAGITGVVFYVGTAVAPNGAFQTVVATKTGPGTWRASLSATDLATLHAAAVDGSGRFRDCPGKGSCYPFGV